MTARDAHTVDHVVVPAFGRRRAAPAGALRSVGDASTTQQRM